MSAPEESDKFHASEETLAQLNRAYDRLRVTGFFFAVAILAITFAGPNLSQPIMLALIGLLLVAFVIWVSWNCRAYYCAFRPYFRERADYRLNRQPARQVRAGVTPESALPAPGPTSSAAGSFEALREELRASTKNRLSIWVPWNLTLGGKQVADQPPGLIETLLMDAAMEAGLLPDGISPGKDGSTYHYRRP